MMPILSPSLVKLEFASMDQIEHGVLSTLFRNELRALVQDCEDRPMDDKPRELCLKVKLTPVVDTNSAKGAYAESINVEFEVTGKIPVRRTRLYSMKPKQSGDLVFQPESSEDPDQMPLEDERRRKSE